MPDWVRFLIKKKPWETKPLNGSMTSFTVHLSCLSNIPGNTTLKRHFILNRPTSGKKSWMESHWDFWLCNSWDETQSQLAYKTELAAIIYLKTPCISVPCVQPCCHNYSVHQCWVFKISHCRHTLKLESPSKVYKSVWNSLNLIPHLTKHSLTDINSKDSKFSWGEDSPVPMASTCMFSNSSVV